MDTYAGEILVVHFNAKRMQSHSFEAVFEQTAIPLLPLRTNSGE